MPDDHDKDPTGEPPARIGDGRLCAYSGCRAPLPASGGPGNKPRYCQDGRTWGSKGVTCKQAGHAEELLSSLGDPGLPPAPALSELGDRIGAALEPARALVTALDQVSAQLGSEVLEAQRQRDDAQRAAAEERGQRQLAGARTAEAEREAAASGRTAEAAVAERDAARAEADRAVHAQRAAEADHRAADDARLGAEARSEQLREQSDHLREQVERIQARADAEAGRAGEAERKLAAAESELAGLHTRVQEERQRAEVERERADQLTVTYGEQLEQARHAVATERDRMSRDQDQLRAELEQRMAEEIDRRERAVAELYERIGRQEQQLADERERADLADRRSERWRGGLREAADWIRGQDAGQDGAGLRDRLEALLIEEER